MGLWGFQFGSVILAKMQTKSVVIAPNHLIQVLQSAVEASSSPRQELFEAFSFWKVFRDLFGGAKIEFVDGHILHLRRQNLFGFLLLFGESKFKTIQAWTKVWLTSQARHYSENESLNHWLSPEIVHIRIIYWHLRSVHLTSNLSLVSILVTFSLI